MASDEIVWSVINNQVGREALVHGQVPIMQTRTNHSVVVLCIQAEDDERPNLLVRNLKNRLHCFFTYD